MVGGVGPDGLDAAGRRAGSPVIGSRAGGPPSHFPTRRRTSRPAVARPGPPSHGPVAAIDLSRLTVLIANLLPEFVEP